MARGRRSQAAESSKSGARRGGGNAAPDVPDVFMDMVNEAMGAPTTAAASSSPRTPKRRKTANSWRKNVREEEERLAREEERERLRSMPVVVVPEPEPELEAAVEEEEEEEEEDEGDMDWEDVDLEKTMASEAAVKAGGDISLVLHDPESLRKGQRQVRRITAVDRKIRLEVHKLHLLCLLAHMEWRNSWCGDPAVQASVSEHLAPRVRESLFAPLEKSQQDRSRLFIDGLTRASKIWKNHFKVTGPGFSLPRWRDSADSVEKLLKEVQMHKFSREDFQKVAVGMEGDADVGAQLFCAMLRSAGVTARLVCSLQALPLGFASKPELEPDKAPEQNYPVYWVEAWNIASQKWICADPLVTGTVNQPNKLEPPHSDLQNVLAYVVAFEGDGTARDVTRRYAKAFNAKTRRLRVSATKGGDKWWRKALRRFEREEEEDRDQVEDAEFSRIELEEGIPKSVADMKDHPLFALERHLKRYEILHPKRKVASITTGTGNAKVTEPVYRRKDVQHVRSPEQWYRLGRLVKAEEQQHPMKVVSARKKPPTNSKRRRHDSSDDELDLSTSLPEAPTSVPLFGEWQTELYVPPPILGGMVPKNQYGNLDIFCPSMIPFGGTHVPHAFAAKACKLLQIDFADAVTGFNFAPRQPVTPILNGVVVASESAEAVKAAIEGLEWEVEEEEQARRELEALGLWKRFLVKLQIKERAGRYFGTDEEEAEVEEALKEREAEEPVMAGGFIPSDQEDNYEPIMAGGFIPSEDKEESSTPAKPNGGRSIFQTAPKEPEEFDFSGAGGFLPSDDEDEQLPDAPAKDPTPPVGDFGGGGFLPSDDEEQAPEAPVKKLGVSEDNTAGGGFLPSEDENEQLSKTAATKPTTPKDNLAGGGFLLSNDEDETLQSAPSKSHTTPKSAALSAKAKGKQKAVSPEPEPEPDSSPAEQEVKRVEEELEYGETFEEDDMDYDWF